MDTFTKPGKNLFKVGAVTIKTTAENDGKSIGTMETLYNHTLEHVVNKHTAIISFVDRTFSSDSFSKFKVSHIKGDKYTEDVTIVNVKFNDKQDTTYFVIYGGQIVTEFSSHYLDTSSDSTQDDLTTGLNTTY